MREFFQNCRNDITGCLDGYLKERKGALSALRPVGPDALDRLLEFTASGKMLRGGLAVLGCLAHGGTDRAAAVRAGAAMELFQSAFLIHDDIMDRDTVRRGRPTIHHQYALLAGREGLPPQSTEHYGGSMGICLGDIALFLGFELLSTLPGGGAMQNALLACAARELEHVGLGQMLDVHAGSFRRGVSEREVLGVYLYKTARYTVTMPLKLGAILAGAAGDELSTVEEFGDNLGMLFQVKDDELGLFGAEAETGKPVGSDLKEGKMTIFICYLLEALDAGRQADVLGMLASGKAGGAELEKVRGMVRSLGVDKRVDALVDGFAKKTGAALEKMSGVGPDYRRILREFVGYNVSRRR